MITKRHVGTGLMILGFTLAVVAFLLWLIACWVVDTRLALSLANSGGILVVAGILIAGVGGFVRLP